MLPVAIRACFCSSDERDECRPISSAPNSSALDKHAADNRTKACKNMNEFAVVHFTAVNSAAFERLADVTDQIVSQLLEAAECRPKALKAAAKSLKRIRRSFMMMSVLQMPLMRVRVCPAVQKHNNAGCFYHMPHVTRCFTPLRLHHLPWCPARFAPADHRKDRLCNHCLHK